ncbi:MAG TPA: hypothetical protein VG621_03815 [Candidatus Paceibacterota bacterium]|nr:hypothetical protein [Candidatus Paceibacterota bacterium]
MRGASYTHAQFNSSSTAAITTNQCNDGIDNNGDGTADRYGVLNSDGTVKYPPDPSCFSSTATTEVKDQSPGGLIPCTNECGFTDVFTLLNNLLTFFIKVLLIPIFVIIIIYAGVKYIQAGANGQGKVNVKNMLMHVIGGVVLILCAWLIVHTIMTTLLNDNFKQAGVEFLGN